MGDGNEFYTGTAENNGAVCYAPPNIKIAVVFLLHNGFFIAPLC